MDIPESMGLNRSNANHIKNQWLKVAFAMVFTAALVMSFPASSATRNDSTEERWFEIELIVFAHLNKDALDSEDWPDIPGPTLPENLQELTLPSPEPDTDTTNRSANPGQATKNGNHDDETWLTRLPIAFEMLPHNEMRLNDAVIRLKNSAHFRPLLHVAWRQPTYDEKHAQTVLVYQGMTDPESEDSNPTEQSDPSGPIIPGITGTIQVSVARYLHLAANLVYRTRVTEQVAIPGSDLAWWDDRPYPTINQRQGPAFQLEKRNVMRGFKLEESRRMRSKTIHYLDNPLFGVIALITPVELIQEQETAPITENTQNAVPPKQ